MVSKKIISLIILLFLSLIISIFLVAVNFNMVKNRYYEIEPNLDNYSAGEILSLSFEKAKNSLLRGDYDDYLVKTQVIGSKIKILESRATLSGAFYHSDEFLSSLDKLKAQYLILKDLNLKLVKKDIGPSVVINFMDDMDYNIIELLEVIYKIQIANFNEVKDIINSNSKKAEWFSILSLFFGFLIIFISFCDVFYVRDLLRKKNLFISSIYHELASSTQAIVMSVDILRCEDSNGEVKEEVDRIDYHANKIIEQTKEVYDYSKIELGVAKVNCSSFLLSEVLSDINESFSARNGNVLRIISSVSNHRIVSDRYKLYRIVMNLIDNSNKYTNNGRITLNVKMNKGKLLVRVKDNGVGFNANEINRLYKAFNQGAEKMTRQGLGLGLTIVQSYVRIMGGRIRVKSKVGMGASFLIIIPVLLAKE